jgi:hypothetical protein
MKIAPGIHRLGDWSIVNSYLVLEWGRPLRAGLNAIASAVWLPAEHESGGAGLD